MFGLACKLSCKHSFREEILICLELRLMYQKEV